MITVNIYSFLSYMFNEYRLYVDESAILSDRNHTYYKFRGIALLGISHSLSDVCKEIKIVCQASEFVDSSTQGSVRSYYMISSRYSIFRTT